jgi:hypothetical protein
LILFQSDKEPIIFSDFVIVLFNLFLELNRLGSPAGLYSVKENADLAFHRYIAQLVETFNQIAIVVLCVFHLQSFSQIHQHLLDDFHGEVSHNSAS